ncbi:MAG: hydrogenase maturation protease [Thermoanaerobacterales bacterium]|nr:hydrogenase maturation protease [Thermoanaerobacterales bacterium]
MKSAVVIGLGDPLLGDRGAGPYVVEALLQERPGLNIELADIGLRLTDLEMHLYGRDYGILVQALARGYPGGHVSQVAYRELQRSRQSPPCLRPVLERLGLMERFGVMPPEVTFVFIEPQMVCEGVGISKNVRYAIRKATRLIKKDLEQRGYLCASPVVPLRYRLELLEMTV